MSARSKATTPKPPACSTRLVAFSARAASPVSLIHSTRDRSMPASAPVEGSNRSQLSTSATTSPRLVAEASTLHSTVVRPADRSPTISDRWPRRSPPPSAASMASTPVAATSAASCHGWADVSVTSSFRSRSSDSMTARAALIFALSSPDDGVKASHRM